MFGYKLFDWGTPEDAQNPNFGNRIAVPRSRKCCSDTFERFPPECPVQVRGKQETMGSADILMLEAGPDPEAKGRWRNEEMDDAFDALPYIDNDYSDPKVKAEVDKLIAEEMRLGPKRPADFLSQLPPAPTFDLEVCSLSFYKTLHRTQRQAWVPRTLN